MPATIADPDDVSEADSDDVPVAEPEDASVADSNDVSVADTEVDSQPDAYLDWMTFRMQSPFAKYSINPKTLTPKHSIQTQMSPSSRPWPWEI